MLLALFCLAIILAVFAVPPSAPPTPPVPPIDKDKLTDEVSLALQRISEDNGPFTNQLLYKSLTKLGYGGVLSREDLAPVFDVVKQPPINVGNVLQEDGNVKLLDNDYDGDGDSSEAAVIEDNNLIDLTGDAVGVNEDKLEIDDEDVSGAEADNDLSAESGDHGADCIDLINCDSSDNGDNGDNGAEDISKLTDIEILTKLNIYSDDDDDIGDGLEDEGDAAAPKRRLTNVRLSSRASDGDDKSDDDDDDKSDDEDDDKSQDLVAPPPRRINNVRGSSDDDKNSDESEKSDDPEKEEEEEEENEDDDDAYLMLELYHNEFYINPIIEARFSSLDDAVDGTISLSRLYRHFVKILIDENVKLQQIIFFSRNVVIEYLNEHDAIVHVGLIGDENGGGNLDATITFIDGLRETPEGDAAFSKLMGFNFEVLGGENELMNGVFGGYKVFSKYLQSKPKDFWKTHSFCIKSAQLVDLTDYIEYDGNADLDAAINPYVVQFGETLFVKISVDIEYIENYEEKNKALTVYRGGNGFFTGMDCVNTQYDPEYDPVKEAREKRNKKARQYRARKKREKEAAKSKNKKSKDKTRKEKKRNDLKKDKNKSKDRDDKDKDIDEPPARKKRKISQKSNESSPPNPPANGATEPLSLNDIGFINDWNRFIDPDSRDEFDLLQLDDMDDDHVVSDLLIALDNFSSLNGENLSKDHRFYLAAMRHKIIDKLAKLEETVSE